MDNKTVDIKNEEEVMVLDVENNTTEATQPESPMSDVLTQKNPKGFKERMVDFGKFLKTQNGWVWLIPALILLAIFTFYPIVNTLFAAFRENYNPLNGISDGWGFGNFSTVVKDYYFLTCLRNTVLFTVISVPASTILALLLSVALSSIKILQKAYQSIFFLPYLTNAMSIGAVFKVMFEVVGTRRLTTSWGLINEIFGSEILWVKAGASTIAQMTVVIVYEIWAGLPFKILILFGALQSVNKQYYDAAKVDGASKNTILWRITVPLVSPQIAYLIVTGIIGGFKSYSAIVGIFGDTMGVTKFSMGTIVGLIYEYIGNNQTGVAAAASLILFAIIMLITAVNMWVSSKKVHY